MARTVSRISGYLDPIIFTELHLPCMQNVIIYYVRNKSVIDGGLSAYGIKATKKQSNVGKNA